ncbi:hypothetical protein V8B97DRAFT_1965190 [Scleroderma yunnanense]
MALSWLWGTSQLDEAVDKATSELIPTGSEDVALNLEICDQIRSKSAPAKDAMRALKRRLNHKNPNVQLLALGLTDTCVKNGGDHFLVEIASREFIDNIVSILRVPGLNHAVKAAILRHIQNWALAFDGKPSLAYVGNVYKTLKSDGFDFPPKDLSHANAAMVDTSTAPEWIDSDVCLRCRSAFTFTNRKHHCRNCGQVFDQQCSSKTLPLPHFGITQPVRVCDSCHMRLTRKATERRHTVGTPRDLADAELQRAIQLSLEDRNRRSGYTPYQPVWHPTPSEPPIVDRTPNGRPAAVEDEDDPDLRAAIEASLREANMPRPSAPMDVQAHEETRMPVSASAPTPVASSTFKLPNYDLEPLESDAILTFNQTVEDVGGRGGRDTSKYPAISELYDRANSVRPKLAMSLDDTGRKEELLADMHDKLSQAVKLYDKLLTEQMTGAWRRASAGPAVWQQQQQPAGLSYASQQQTSSHAQAGPSQSQPPLHAHAPTPYAYQAPSQPVSIPSFTAAPLPQQQPQLQTQVQAQPMVTSPPPPLPQSQLQPQLQPQQLQPQLQQRPPQSIGAPAQSLPPPTPTPITPILPTTTTILPTSTSPLARRSTVSSSRTTGVAVSGAGAEVGVVRSGTVGRGYTHGQMQGGRYQQLTTAQTQPTYPAQRETPVPVLPQFPVAPTSNPQSFDMYMPSAPVGVPSLVGQGQERKEELLIDL